MSAPGIENYRFGQKNNWRRRVWNEISRRVKDKKNARILYLAGEQNLDALVAEEKGYDARNMIAIEIDKKRTESLRKQGVTTICGSIMDVLHAWPTKHKVDVVIADFCFGFESSSIDIYDSLSSPALVDSVVLINFQRGRDKSTNFVRRFFNGSTIFYQSPNGDIKEAFPPKHRAGQFLLFHAWETINTVLTGKSSSEKIEVDSEMLKNPKHCLMIGRIFQSMNPEFFSYKSNRVYMDSAVFSHCLHISSKESRSLITKVGGWKNNLQPHDENIKRQITAALAVQSRRKSL